VSHFGRHNGHTVHVLPLLNAYAQKNDGMTVVYWVLKVTNGTQ